MIEISGPKSLLSKTLVKLIDEAILPALLLVITKILGTLFINSVFNIPWELTRVGINYPDGEAYIKSNSYSSLLMVFIIFVFLLWVLIRAHHFHNTHVNPRVSKKLTNLKFGFLVKSSFEIYSKAAVWLSYSYLLTIILSIQAFFGLSYTWVAIISFLISINMTWFLISDMEKEMKINKGNLKDSERLPDLEL